MPPFPMGPSAAMRSAPCACGSRRAFRACCERWNTGLQRVLSRVAAFVEQPELRDIRSAAATTYPYTEESPAFWEWFLCDYAPPRRAGSVLASYADAEGDASVEEQAALRAVLFTPARPYQAIEAARSSGLVLKDVLSGSEATLGLPFVPAGTIPSDVVVSRAVPIGRFRRPLICWLVFPPSVQTDLVAYLRGAYRLLQTGRHVAIDDFADMHGDLYHAFLAQPGREARVLATARLEPWAPAQVQYACSSVRRASAALDREPALERQLEDADADRRYVWWGGPAGSTGTVALRADVISASANTRRDLVQIRQLLETGLKGLITFIAEGPAPPDVPSASDGQRPAGRAFLDRMLANWPDLELPALDGHSPRAACATTRGQHAVVRLLVDLERDLAHQKRIGRAWVDPSGLWETLGLTRPPIIQDSPPARPTSIPLASRRARLPRRGRPRS